MKNYRHPAAVAALVLATVVVLASGGQAAQSRGSDVPINTLLVTICHQPGTRAESTLTLPPVAVEGHLTHGDTRGICPANRLRELLPFLQNSNLVQVDTGRLLEGIRAGEPVGLPCAAPGGEFVVIPSRLTERDLRAPSAILAGIPFLNTYEVVMDASMRAGVFSITEEDFRSWVTDPHLGQCFAEPIGPLLRGNNVPESEVERILAVANVIVYNTADLSASINLLNDVQYPTISDDGGPRIATQLSPPRHLTGGGGNTRDFGVLSMGYVADGNFQNAVYTEYNVSGTARDTKPRELLGWYYSRLYDTLHWYEPSSSREGHNRYNIIPVRHLTGGGGNTPNFGVLFMGYVADINFQNALGTAYNVSGAARDTKVRELLGWYNARLYDTLHWYEPSSSRGGHNRYNIIPVVGSIDLCTVAATDAQATNCPHTPQHVNVGVSQFGNAGAGRSWQGTLGCGGSAHPGAVVNGQPLKNCNLSNPDVNHAGIFWGSGVADAAQNFLIGHEVGHVFGCEPSGAPGENVAPQTPNHTAATVTFDGVTGPSFMIAQGNFGVGNDPRPLYTDACDVAIANIVNSNILPPVTN